jgi:hypothetical protein
MCAQRLSEQVIESDNAMGQVNGLKKVKSTLTTNLGMTVEY